MNYKETLNYIHSLGNFSLPVGLERILAALEKLGNPQKNLKAIHIAGTNGKGSVSAMVSNILITAGYKTGLFISPFIIDFRERIQINGEFISENDLVSFAKRVIDTEVKLTEFEFITAVAFLYFKEKNIDVLVCETGLGGRFDATNTLENKAVAVITKIGLDHIEVLGDSIDKITEEKCGIIKGSPVVTSPYQDNKALNVIKKYTDNFCIPNVSKLLVLKDNTFIYKDRKYEIGLLGDYQIENAITAIEAVEQSGYHIPYNIIYEGLKNVRFPARMEIISKKPLVVLDGAHNPDGAKALAKELKKYSGKVTAIIGMMKDKNIDEVLKETLIHCKNAVAIEVFGMPRSLERSQLLGVAQKYCPCFTANSYIEAVDFAMEISDNQPVFVFGSLYLASAIRPILKEKFKYF